MQDDNEGQIELAPSLIARNAFTSFDCSWYFVELVEGEFEEIGGEEIGSFAPSNLKVMGGVLPINLNRVILNREKYFLKSLIGRISCHRLHLYK